jgi:hypothetical protein
VGNAFAKLFCALGGIVLGVLILINAYGLTIRSWPWLVWGTLGQLALLAASGAWSKSDD